MLPPNDFKCESNGIKYHAPTGKTYGHLFGVAGDKIPTQPKSESEEKQVGYQGERDGHEQDFTSYTHACHVSKGCSYLPSFPPFLHEMP